MIRRASRFVLLPVLVVVLAVVAAGCGSSGGSSGSASGTTTTAASGGTTGSSTASSTTVSSGSTTAATSTAPSHVDVNLTFSGDVTGTLVGHLAICDYYIPGTQQGLRYEVHGSDYGKPELGGLQLSAESPTATPAAILNVPGTSYGWYPQTGTIHLQADRTKATIDATLTKVVGSGTVHVTGTIACG